MITFGPALNYIWTINGATLVSGGQPGDIYAVVRYDTAGSASVKVEVFNACGMATTTRNVAVNNACAGPDLTTVSPSGDVAVSAIAGSVFTLGPVSVNFISGSPVTAYQWYRNTVKSTTGATLLSTGTSNTLVATESDAGTYYYYCVMTNAGCNSASVNTGFYTVSVVNIPSAAGTGNFTGKTCFDIAYSNFSGDCGTETTRKSQRTDFSLATEQDAGSSPVYTGRQVYTFTPSGNISNVRFVYLDASGQAIESMTPKGDYSGNRSPGDPCKAVVVYKATLNEFLRGKTRSQAVKPELYVIYNDQQNNSGVDRAFKLTVSLQDCACCGAATTTGGWLNFMCHNLGADESLDPFAFVLGNADGSGGTLGDLYQWGRQKDGHEKRNSPNYPNNNSVEENGAVPSTALDTNTGQVIVSHAAYGKFIKDNNSGYVFDWRQIQKDNLWGDGSTSENMAKDVNNDPCPPGWKVPSQKQWASISGGSTTSPNTWTWVSYGYKVGSSLYLPAAGYRERAQGTLVFRSTQGVYWSSSADASRRLAYYLSFSSTGGGSAAGTTYRGYGASVRCVSE